MPSRDKVKKLAAILRTRGVRGLTHALLIQSMKHFARPLADFDRWAACFRGKRGLEIGGPSQIFSMDGVLPVYPLLAALDNCNFAAKTAWGAARDGDSVVLGDGRIVGRHHVMEAVDLCGLSSGAYDFVLASHVLEHLANPVFAYLEWWRVLRPGGVLVVVVPRKERTFDHRRPVTKWEHLLADFESEVDESDLTHLDEVLSLHDLIRDPDAGTKDEFIVRSRKNLELRCLHHHVFDHALLERFTSLAPIQDYSINLLAPDHIALLVRKRLSGCGESE